jgi:putative PIG3 family NAD(P)H quinone oxidoreductase
MRAIQDEQGRLSWSSAPQPKLEPGSVRIRVSATAVNRADLVQRAGHYPPPPGVTSILGLECSGVVSELGEGVRGWKLGDEVCALLAGGGYAEEVVVPAGHVLPIPDGISLLEAAAIPEVYTTAWLNLRLEGGLQPGERVLVHAGASGVGTAAVQLCSAWGNPVVVTAGGEKKCRRVLALGASLAIDRHLGPWASKATAEGKFDVILDPVGGSYLESNIWSLNKGGRLINIGLMGGREGTLPLAPLLTKRLQIKGSVLRSRSSQEKSEILAGVQEHVWPLFQSGALRPIIHQVLDIEEAEQAHTLLRSNQTVGKILLRIIS